LKERFLLLWTAILKSADHASAAARVLASLGLSLEQFARNDDAMASVIDLEQESLPASADASGQLWIHCSCIARLIERVSDPAFFNRLLFDELAQLESWAEYTASPADCVVMVPALRELQREICLAYGIASRHISALLIWVTGSGVPLRQLSASMANCRFGYKDILATCNMARQIVPGRQLLSDRDARVYGLEVPSSAGPLDPIAVLLDAVEYKPYVQTLPWHGYDVEPFLLHGSGYTLGSVFARFDADARSGIVLEIEGH
jgi:hypothetical protein